MTKWVSEMERSADWHYLEGKVLAVDFKYVKKWQAKENRIFSMDLTQVPFSCTFYFDFIFAVSFEIFNLWDVKL